MAGRVDVGGLCVEEERGVSESGFVPWFHPPSTIPSFLDNKFFQEFRVAAELKVLFTRQLDFHTGTVHKYTNFKHSLGLTKPFNNNLFLVSQPATVR